MIVSIVLLILAAQNQSIYSLIEVTKSDSYFYIIIALAIYLVVLSVLGIYGSFFRDETIIKLVSSGSRDNLILATE